MQHIHESIFKFFCIKTNIILAAICIIYNKTEHHFSILLLSNLEMRLFTAISLASLANGQGEFIRFCCKLIVTAFTFVSKK